MEVKTEVNNEKADVLQENMWTSQEKMKASQKEMKSKIDALVSWMHDRQAKAEANHEELMATLKASQERMESLMNVSLETTEACLEKTEANQEKVETKMEACAKEMEVETIGAPEDQSGDQQLAVECRNPLKMQTKDNVVHRTPQGWTFGKSHRAQLKCNNGIRDQGLKQQL
jgi:hypothetical protein